MWNGRHACARPLHLHACSAAHGASVASIWLRCDGKGSWQRVLARVVRLWPRISALALWPRISVLALSLSMHCWQCSAVGSMHCYVYSVWLQYALHTMCCTVWAARYGLREALGKWPCDPLGSMQCDLVSPLQRLMAAGACAMCRWGVLHALRALACLCQP
jgi:hypothetical protein